MKIFKRSHAVRGQRKESIHSSITLLHSQVLAGRVGVHLIFVKGKKLAHWGLKKDVQIAKHAHARDALKYRKITLARGEFLIRQSSDQNKTYGEKMMF